MLIPFIDISYPHVHHRKLYPYVTEHYPVTCMLDLLSISLTNMLDLVTSPCTPALGVCHSELDWTSELAVFFIKWTMIIVELVIRGKVAKKYQGAMSLSLKVQNLGLHINQKSKHQKMKIALTRPFLMSLVSDFAHLQ